MEHMQVLQPVMNKSWVHNRNEKMEIKKPLLASTKRGLSGLQWILRLLPIALLSLEQVLTLKLLKISWADSKITVVKYQVKISCQSKRKKVSLF